MTDRIEDLLQRRSDLSTFLVHFTRAYRGSARANLLAILEERVIEARAAYGMGKGRFAADTDFQDSQRVVCFTETPFEHAWMMCADMEGRAHRLSGYGLAITKVWARSQGVNPVWYLDISARGVDWLTKPINALLNEARDAARLSGDSMAGSHIAKIAPFIEQMGPTKTARKEFWWEREWRHVGDFSLPTTKVVAVFAPEDDHDDFDDELRDVVGQRRPPVLDSRWGLERMISKLRGIDDDIAGPLPPYP
jgi:Putative abortive phage resistance protein AbiGi, antitoxin